MNHHSACLQFGETFYCFFFTCTEKKKTNCLGIYVQKRINLFVMIESRPFGFESYHIRWSQNSIAIENIPYFSSLSLLFSLILHISGAKCENRTLNTLSLHFTICAIENMFLHALIAHHIHRNSHTYRRVFVLCAPYISWYRSIWTVIVENECGLMVVTIYGNQYKTHIFEQWKGNRPIVEIFIITHNFNLDLISVDLKCTTPL